MPAFIGQAEVELRQRESAAAQNLPPPVVSMHMRTGPDRRRYNDPHFDEVAAIFTSADGAAEAPQYRGLSQIKSP